MIDALIILLNNNIMNSTKKYIIENILTNYWKKYFSIINNEIFNIFKQQGIITDHKLAQKLLFYTMSVIGICGVPSYIFFPHTKDLLKYENILYDDIIYNWKINKDIFREIMDVIITENKNTKIQIKLDVDKFLESSIQKIIINKKYSENSIDLIVIHPDYPNKYTISIDDYKKLKNRFIQKEKYFDVCVCMLLQRYKFYDYLKEGINLSANDVYDFIQYNNFENESLEVFAGSLNSSLTNYCSLFEDIEKYFGSLGSFFRIDLSECNYEILISNPPYATFTMTKLSIILLDYIKKCSPSMCIVIIPDWRSIEEYDNDKNIININCHTQDRSITRYDGYSNLRESKYFKYAICVGDYGYHNFYKNKTKKIAFNTLFIVLSNNDDDKANLFKKWIIKKIKNE